MYHYLNKVLILEIKNDAIILVTIDLLHLSKTEKLPFGRCDCDLKDVPSLQNVVQ